MKTPIILIYSMTKSDRWRRGVFLRTCARDGAGSFLHRHDASIYDFYAEAQDL